MIRSIRGALLLHGRPGVCWAGRVAQRKHATCQSGESETFQTDIEVVVATKKVSSSPSIFLRSREAPHLNGKHSSFLICV
jgi:hypothetical protein